jgi:protein transport protein HofC
MEQFFRWLLGPWWVVFFGRAEAARQRTLLWTLAVAVEKQFPMVPFLQTLADEAGGRWRWRLRGLAELITAGVSIPEALEAMPGLLPRDTVAMIRVGARSGNMTGALREAARLASLRSSTPVGQYHGSLIYFFALLGTVTVVLTFLMVFIMPKYKAIFAGFDARLPPLTEFVIVASDFIASYWYLFLLSVPAACLVLWMAMGVGLEFIGCGPWWSRPSTLLANFWPRLKTPHVLRSLSVAVDGGRPLPQALTALAEQNAESSFRRLMVQIADEVSRGNDCWTALRGAHMLRRSEPALLEAAQKLGNLVWALRGMADGIERRADYRYHILLEMVHPILIVAVGIVVGTICAGMFVPLITLVKQLSGDYQS